ncbi:MAG: hypothetical protein NTY55_12115 [Flavobacteriia bacterium]|nr:hypothetical protein [Flavobacteriia bacterium]
MKNKSLLLFLLVFSQWSFSQTFTTGVVNLSSTAGLTMSVKLDISTNVTMTITGPSLRWFALGFGAVNMANGTDVVGIHSAAALPNFDAKLTGNAAASITVSPITTTTTYSCTATENGASATANSVITVSSNSSSTITQTACNSYIWNGDTLTTSGTYSALFQNTGGCDSLANLNLTIETAPLAPMISVSNGNQFSILPSSIQNGVNYQWVICPELIAIDGATDTIFAPSDGGEYAVVATNSCGSVTSDCYLSTVSLPHSISNLANGFYYLESKSEKTIIRKKVQVFH